MTPVLPPDGGRRPAGLLASVLVAAGLCVAISFVLMFVVLAVSGNEKTARFTGAIAGALVATYIAIEAPYSGMSMNPARTIASAVVARKWRGFWIYMVAPPIAMLLAAETYVATIGGPRDACAKLHHASDVDCIFCGSPEHTH